MTQHGGVDEPPCAIGTAVVTPDRGEPGDLPRTPTVRLWLLLKTGAPAFVVQYGASCALLGRYYETTPGLVSAAASQRRRPMTKVSAGITASGKGADLGWVHCETTRMLDA